LLRHVAIYLLPKPQQLVAPKSVKEHQLHATPESGGGGSTLSNQLSTFHKSRPLRRSHAS
jgi:hypothetical protein